MWLQYLFPVVGSAGALLFTLTNPKPLFLAAGGLFAFGSIAMGFGMYYQQRYSTRHKISVDRDRYLAYLDRVRPTLQETARCQSLEAAWRQPGPAELWSLTGSPFRAWERRAEDDDFLEVRLGLGRQPLVTPLRLAVDDNPLTEHDAVSVLAARRLVARHEVLDRQPVTVPLARTRLMSVVGDSLAARALARALVCQLVAFHAPEDLRLVVYAAPDVAAQWEWVKWLPHTKRTPDVYGSSAARLLAGDFAELETLLETQIEARRRGTEQSSAGGSAGLGNLGLLGSTRERSEPEGAAMERLVVVVDGARQAPRLSRLLESMAGLGISLVNVAAAPANEPAGADVRVQVGRDAELAVETVTSEGVEVVGARADEAGPALCEALSRRLAPLRLSAESSPRRLVDTVSLPQLLALPDVGAIQPEETWQYGPGREPLRVPLGIAGDGEPILLDLKESAAGGMGPHGLVVGATGSGKSELLRTLVLGLTITHPPELVSLVLVDFKGGATFAGLAELPHVAGLITNLQDDLALVDRMYDALVGEQLRRQELLRKAGNLNTVGEYQELCAAGADLEPLPYLVIIVDEFGELLTSRPDFIRLFVGIGRVGRSLGMHLLLASQQLDEGRLRGLEGHLSYRICLRVFSAMESRSVIGVPDAYNLPQLPGSAYLKVDPLGPKRFKVAMVSDPYRRSVAEESTRPRAELFTARLPAAEVGGPADLNGSSSGSETAKLNGKGTSVLQVAVGRLRDGERRAHQVWLPPLERALPLDSLLPSIGVHAERGLVAASWPGVGKLSVPLGLVDRPTEQAKAVLAVDFSGSGGHLAIVGAPQAGKSTLLRTLITSFALTHTPTEVQFYCVDFGGGGLQSLDPLPHVGTVSGRFDPEQVGRVVSEVFGVLDHRERLFRSKGIDSAQTMRAMRAAGELGDEVLGDVFLVIDHWGAMRQDFEDLEESVLAIAARGLGYGVHLVITANRWMEIRANLRDLIAGRLELRLNDPVDSEVDRRIAANVANVPGRGLTPEGLHFQAALPRVDGLPVTTDLQAAVERVVRDVGQGWTGPGAPPARVLPRRMLFTELPMPGADREPGVPIGLAEQGLQPVYLDLSGGDPHFIIFGDGESGKTTLLRTYLTGLTARAAEGRAAILIVDYRRTLLDAVSSDHLWAYAGAAPAATDAVNRLRDVLVSRQPGVDLTVKQLRERSWWTGPEFYVIVDDYDLVVTPSDNPLYPLVDFLPQSRDLGLHVIVARRAGGASRALLEPLLLRLKELGSSGILFSGDRQEGPLLGSHAATTQPPGRGLLVRRRHPATVVQTAWVPE